MVAYDITSCLWGVRYFHFSNAAVICNYFRGYIPLRFKLADMGTHLSYLGCLPRTGSLKRVCCLLVSEKRV